MALLHDRGKARMMGGRRACPGGYAGLGRAGRCPGRAGLIEGVGNDRVENTENWVVWVTLVPVTRMMGTGSRNPASVSVGV